MQRRNSSRNTKYLVLGGIYLILGSTVYFNQVKISRSFYDYHVQQNKLISLQQCYILKNFLIYIRFKNSLK